MDAFDNMAHQLVLLAIDPSSGRVRRRADVALAAAGGALAELALQERVSLVDKKIRVHDPRPTEDPLLDIMLGVLAQHGERRPARILTSARKAYLTQALAELVANGWVALTPGFGFVGDRYEILNTELLARVQEMATTAMRDPRGVSSRLACLGGLAANLGLTKELLPEAGLMDRWRLKRELASREWVVKAMADVIAARQAAVAASAASVG